MMPYKQTFDLDGRNSEEYLRMTGSERRMQGGLDHWGGFEDFSRNQTRLGNGDLELGGGPWHLECDREGFGGYLDGRGGRSNTRLQEPAYRDALITQLSSSYHQQQQHPQAHLAPSHSLDTLSTLNARTTLWWGDLEPWMDEEYVKQVCALMGWDHNSGNGDGVTVKIPNPPPDQLAGNHSNNPGYCFLTFPTTQQAANVLAKLNNPHEKLPTMPNSSRPFNLNWAPNLTPASVASVSQNTTSTAAAKPPSSIREYSIFVGDLAPEASNSDLLAVFRNPILGLRSDRAPKVVKPFYSAKSAKIMLDPVTGVSKGYGFVRFTDQAEQQRALMEMHGLYCLSRPMRVSPATAKFKPASPLSATTALPGSNSFMSSLPSLSSSEGHSFNASLDSIPTPNRSVSTPLAGGERKPFPLQVDPRTDLSLMQQLSSSQSVAAFEESWNSPANAQARAILANLTGPNGEQLSSADPYNTTVFVGGLSPLISEETLRTFFAPFGDIHYVKVPVGKHCGFVQFVRKADAQRAIDRMQGFPIGGSRIRLSWGRSQYKAAQAVVQQAQVQAQLSVQTQVPQSQYPPAPHMSSNQTTPKNLSGNGPSITAQLTPQQALDLLSRYGYQGMVPTNGHQHTQSGIDHGPLSPPFDLGVQNGILQDMSRINALPHPDSQHGHGGFSPFEPQPPPMNDVMLSHSQTQSFNRAPGFGPSLSLPADLKITHHRSKESNASGSPRSASTHTVFSSGEGNYNQFFDGGRSGYHLNVADILRKDSQAMPRSSSNSSQRGDPDASMKHSHSTSFTGMKSNGLGDVAGMLKNLSLDLHDNVVRQDELDITTVADIRQPKESAPSPRPVDSA